MRFRKPRKLTDSKDIEEHWKQAFPDPPKPTYSPKAIKMGATIGGAIVGCITFYFLLDFCQERYGEIYWGSTHHHQYQGDGRIPVGYILLASIPGVLIGMAIGAFLGAKLGPKG